MRQPEVATGIPTSPPWRLTWWSGGIQETQRAGDLQARGGGYTAAAPFVDADTRDPALDCELYDGRLASPYLVERHEPKRQSLDVYYGPELRGPFHPASSSLVVDSRHVRDHAHR